MWITFELVNVQKTFTCTDLQTDMKTQNDKLANVKYSLVNLPSAEADVFI